jgi:DNA-binding NarL/FixJ family response regulator
MDNITTDFITIVLVEDHDLTRIGMKAALQRQPDIQILGEAENGAKGLQLLQISRPTVAIVDIGYPIWTELN